MSVGLLWFLIDIDICFSCLMTEKHQIKGGSVDQDKKTNFMEWFDYLKHCDKNTKKAQIRNFWEKYIDDILIWSITKIRISL